MSQLVPDWLLERVAKDPAAPALQSRSATWSRLELLRAVDGLAAALLGEGIGESSRIACLLADDAPAITLVHAARRLGAVLVPLNRRAASGELRYQLRTVAAQALLCDAGQVGLASKCAPDGVAVHRIEALLAAAPCGLPPVLRIEVDLDAHATIVFTSGTTGRPKGAILTHRNHTTSAHAWAGLLQPRPSDRWLACLPLFHVAGLALITRTTRWGAPLEVMPAFDAAELSRSLDAGVTHLSLVAAQLRRLLVSRQGSPVPPTLRAILLGGGPIPVDLVVQARAAGYPVLTTYGMTETGSGVVSGGSDDATLEDPLAGRPLPGVKLRIEPDGAPDGSGEVLVSGGMVFAGYVGDTDGSAAKLRHGWLHSGDIGTLDSEGLLRIVDRRADLIVSGGENIYPAELEAVLAAHVAVSEVAVVGLPDPQWGAVPVAAVVSSPGADVSDAELERHCRERMAGYKLPARFARMDALPRDDLGKIRRAELRDTLAQEQP